MVDQTGISTTQHVQLTRDERSMRVFEYAMAFIALAAALLLHLS
jgi:hypothetical protein